ncbi:uncharacterized protein LOC111366545 [Olea europaea var. sylvestris]|uniref:uncharacterized protein LOC111366545 n=1 Tax=Olea europaea var. sylvestris TaxID=158386 RepID=UPI000C1D57AA|nr:uncharacterized protein LOC111366545 [Olea europaea var. sylvestris]
MFLQDGMGNTSCGDYFVVRNEMKLHAKIEPSIRTQDLQKIAKNLQLPPLHMGVEGDKQDGSSSPGILREKGEMALICYLLLHLDMEILRTIRLDNTESGFDI